LRAPAALVALVAVAPLLLPLLPVASAEYTDRYTYFTGLVLAHYRAPTLGNDYGNQSTLICWFRWDTTTLYLDCLDRAASGTSLVLGGPGVGGVILYDGGSKGWVMEYNGTGYMLGGDKYYPNAVKTRYLAAMKNDRYLWTGSGDPYICTWFSNLKDTVAGFNYLCFNGECHSPSPPSTVYRKKIGGRVLLTPYGLARWTGSQAQLCSLPHSKCYDVTHLPFSDPYPGGATVFVDPVRLHDILVGSFNDPSTPQSVMVVIDVTDDKILGYYSLPGWSFVDLIPLENPVHVAIYDAGGTVYLVQLDTVDPTGLPGGLTYTSLQESASPTGLPSIQHSKETDTKGVWYYGKKTPEDFGLMIYTKWSGTELTPPQDSIEGGEGGEAGGAVPVPIFYVKPEETFMHSGCVVNLWPVEWEGQVNGYAGETVEWRLVTWDSRNVWPSIKKTGDGYNVTWFNESGPPSDYIYRGWYTVLYVPYTIYNSTGGDYDLMLESCRGQCWENTIEFDYSSFLHVYNDTATGGRKYSFYWTGSLPREPGYYVVARILRIWDARHPVEFVYYCVDAGIGAVEIYGNETDDSGFLTRSLMVVFRPLITAVKSIGAAIVGALASLLPEELASLFSALYQVVSSVITGVVGSLGEMVEYVKLVLYFFPLIIAGVAVYDPLLLVELFRKMISVLSSILSALRSLIPV